MIKRLWRSNNFGWRTARIFLMLCVGLVLSVLVLVMAFEDKFIFFPAKYPEGFWEVDKLQAREGEVVPAIEDCFFTTEDGLRLHGWYCAPVRKSRAGMEPVPSDMTLLWLHGNAGNITHRYEIVRVLMRLPVNVFIIDYRGYGKSEGKPSEEGLYLDARAALDYVTKARGVELNRVIVFGESLGGVPAIDLAGKADVAGLIVQSSFTSAADMAATVLPLFPRSLLRSKMDSVGKIAVVRCPKLFIHSPDDDVVPYKLGRKLFEAAPDPKRFYEVKGALHNDTHITGGRAYLEAVGNFVRSCSPV